MRKDMEQQPDQTEKITRKRLFGRGIYNSKDIPIRLLDGLIAVLIIAIIILTIIFTINGGYQVTFDTVGGSEVSSQKLRQGKYVEQPNIPIKPGYEFCGWLLKGNEKQYWDFNNDKITEDITLIADWSPAKVIVKFDLEGGILPDKEKKMEVTFGSLYETLPIPSKEGAIFKGWFYSGQYITEETIVTMTGEHVLTAVWEEIKEQKNK